MSIKQGIFKILPWLYIRYKALSIKRIYFLFLNELQYVVESSKWENIFLIYDTMKWFFKRNILRSYMRKVLFTIFSKSFCNIELYHFIDYFLVANNNTHTIKCFSCKNMFKYNLTWSDIFYSIWWKVGESPWWKERIYFFLNMVF